MQVRDARKRMPKDIAIASPSTINDGMALLVEDGLLEEVPRESTAQRRRFRVVDHTVEAPEPEVIQRNGNEAMIEGIELGRIASALERIAKVLEAHE